jgi:uncharacterized protein YkwD
MRRLLPILLVLLHASLVHADKGTVQVDLDKHRERLGVPQADLAKTSAQIVDLTNAFRREQNLPEVKSNPTLTQVAQSFADFMASEGKYGHEADGRQPGERAEAGKYDYCLVLENIAYIFREDGIQTDALAKQFTTNWQESPGHRKNMLDPDIADTGVAVARSKGGIYFAVQMFGRPKSAMVEVQVMNRSKADVTYAINGERYTIKPRTGRMHGLCRPPTLAFVDLPKNAKPLDEKQLKPTKATTYTVTDNGVNVRAGK